VHPAASHVAILGHGDVGVPELATYDPDKWECPAEWRLARAHAAPSKLVALNEIRASLRRPALRMTTAPSVGGCTVSSVLGRLAEPRSSDF
jgi:hypothetical protein